MSRETSDVLAWVVIAAVILAILGGVIGLLCWVCPRYNIWSSQMGGRAELAHAQFSRQVAVQEASAKLHSATLLAQAEVERAKGVAAANKIIGDSLKGNEGYLRYLWITGLESGAGREVVYIPTEAGLPILEANRFGKQGAGAGH